MLEIVNSPLYDHGFQPRLELDEPAVHALVAGAIRELRPDVAHVQELAGLPSSILDELAAADIPSVMTLQDYFPLCPSFKLLDHAGHVCLRRDVGQDCVMTMATELRPPELLHAATLSLHLQPLRRVLPSSVADRAIGRFAAAGTVAVGRSSTATADDYQQRREVNVARLNGVDQLIAMSRRVAEIYTALGVDPERLRTEQLTLRHIAELRPRPRRRADAPIVFATLGGGESAAKGADLLLDAVDQLGDLAGRMRLLLMGTVEIGVARRAASMGCVGLVGRFTPGDQNALLDNVDVGIVPSVWEEGWAYAGIEFLAKGVPVIASAIGAMPEYVIEGETGWLNRSLSSSELAGLMRDIVEHPEQLETMRPRLLSRRGDFVITMSQHAAVMENIYRGFVNRRAA